MGWSGAYAAVNLGLPSFFGVIGCIGAGAAAGFVNGKLVTRAFGAAFIVSLGMMALVISDGRVIYGLPCGLLYLGQGRPFGIPMPVTIFLLVALVMHYILAFTRFGRYTLAIGDSKNAARTAGINVERHRVWLYTLSGGLAGLLFMTRINSGAPTAGISHEVTAITAAIIGGTNLFGGRGSILGSVIGALIMGMLQNRLNLLAVQSYTKPWPSGPC